MKQITIVGLDIGKLVDIWIFSMISSVHTSLLFIRPSKISSNVLSDLKKSIGFIYRVASQGAVMTVELIFVVVA